MDKEDILNQKVAPLASCNWYYQTASNCPVLGHLFSVASDNAHLDPCCPLIHCVVRKDLMVLPNPVLVPTVKFGFMSDGAPQYTVVDWCI
jgi:hypothetical protein